MGTNYFWRFKECEHCNRYEEVHVGKSSAGWSFAFRAYPHQLMNAEHPDWGYDPESPFGVPVLARHQWRDIFYGFPGHLVTEYGREIDDPVDWLDSLEPPTPDKLSWEQQQMHWPEYMTRTDWRDADGFRFDSREFS